MWLKGAEGVLRDGVVAGRGRGGRGGGQRKGGDSRTAAAMGSALEGGREDAGCLHTFSHLPAPAHTLHTAPARSEGSGEMTASLMEVERTDILNPSEGLADAFIRTYVYTPARQLPPTRAGSRGSARGGAAAAAMPTPEGASALYLRRNVARSRALMRREQRQQQQHAGAEGPAALGALLDGLRGAGSVDGVDLELEADVVAALRLVLVCNFMECKVALATERVS